MSIIVIMAGLFLLALPICAFCYILSKRIGPWVAFVYVPLMGGISLLSYIVNGYNSYAITLGILLFSIQWYFIYRSKRFNLLWKKKAFRIAYTVNSIIRLPASVIIDAVTATSISKYILGWSNQTVPHEANTFSSTLILTLLQGIIIQAIYAIVLLVLFAITSKIMKAKEHA